MTANRDVEARAFLAALKKDRCDTTTRLVYADWLEEDGQDDEALEQRRMASKEWVEAARRMEALALRGGAACTNYGANKSKESEIWEPITFDMLIQAGHDWVQEQDWFVQTGDETLRNMMRGDLLRQYWDDWRTITGYSGEIPLDEWAGGSFGFPNPFSCSC